MKQGIAYYAAFTDSKSQLEQACVTKAFLVTAGIPHEIYTGVTADQMKQIGLGIPDHIRKDLTAMPRYDLEHSTNDVIADQMRNGNYTPHSSLVVAVKPDGTVTPVTLTEMGFSIGSMSPEQQDAFIADCKRENQEKYN